jgi:hypothetical protein
MEVRVAGMADVPGAGGHEKEDSLTITKRYRIRESAHRACGPGQVLTVSRMAHRW